MKSLVDMINNTEKKEKIAETISSTARGNNKEFFKYENRLRKINKKTNKLKYKNLFSKLDSKSTEYINDSIDYLMYHSRKGYLNQVTRLSSRNISKKDIDSTIEKLQNLREDNSKSYKNTKYKINKIKDSIENKIQGKKRYDFRLKVMFDNLNKLNSLKEEKVEKEISQKDFDEIAYCKKSIEKNKYIEKKYPEKQDELLEKFNNILEKRYKYFENKEKKRKEKNNRK